MRAAEYWITTDKDKNIVQCLLCPHVCVIPENGKGLCRVRQNRSGTLELLNYGKVTAIALDPIEKKPLKLFQPQTSILSLGTFGCNLACRFCQNWSIAQTDETATEYLAPGEAVELALKLAARGNIGIAYTYSEPLMWYEYVLDTAKLARDAGLENVLVTNGYLNPKPLKKLLPYIDAVNLDIKAYTEGFYHDMCRGSLAPVLRNARIIAGYCHLEITTLIIPGMNDSPEEIGNLASWIAQIDKDIPLHLSRYFPNYRLNIPPTPLSTLKAAGDKAKESLKHVFLGNV